MKIQVVSDGFKLTDFSLVCQDKKVCLVEENFSYCNDHVSYQDSRLVYELDTEKKLLKWIKHNYLHYPSSNIPLINSLALENSLFFYLIKFRSFVDRKFEVYILKIDRNTHKLEVYDHFVSDLILPVKNVDNSSLSLISIRRIAPYVIMWHKISNGKYSCTEIPLDHLHSIEHSFCNNIESFVTANIYGDELWIWFTHISAQGNSELAIPVIVADPNVRIKNITSQEIPAVSGAIFVSPDVLACYIPEKRTLKMRFRDNIYESRWSYCPMCVTTENTLFLLNEEKVVSITDNNQEQEKIPALRSDTVRLFTDYYYHENNLFVITYSYMKSENLSFMKDFEHCLNSRWMEPNRLNWNNPQMLQSLVCFATHSIDLQIQSDFERELTIISANPLKVNKSKLVSDREIVNFLF
jgi:hypothetical protein